MAYNMSALTYTQLCQPLAAANNGSKILHENISVSVHMKHTVHWGWKPLGGGMLLVLGLVTIVAHDLIDSLGHGLV